jgi:CubicO group peptidase (beta-lactamase class C family)
MRLVQWISVLLCFCLTVGCSQSIQTTESTPKTDLVLKEVKESNICGLAVYVDEQLIIEYYKEGYDQNSKFPIEACTRSILSTLIGIAIDEGNIQSTNQYVCDFFASLTITDNSQKKICLHHLLNQTSGLRWPEGPEYKATGEHNLIANFVNSSDWVQFVMQCPMEATPGKRFNYSTGNSHLLSAILQQATGQSTFAYADKHLFKPLGINNIDWAQDPNGINIGSFGINMTILDMAKIGLLYLHQGEWHGKQLVSKEWIKHSWTKQSEGIANLGAYGYQWWLRTANSNVNYDIYFAYGMGGQYIFVIPGLKTVAVFTAKLPNNASFKPIEIVENTLIPMITKGNSSI